MVHALHDEQQADTKEPDISTTPIEFAHDHPSPALVVEPTSVVDPHTIDSVDTSIHQSVESVEVQPFTDQSLVGGVPADETTIRKSGRISKPSIWLKDYVTTSSIQNHPYCISNTMSYTHLSANYKAYMGVSSATVEPKNFKEACQDKNWVEAMSKQIKALENNATWEILTYLLEKGPWIQIGV